MSKVTSNLHDSFFKACLHSSAPTKELVLAYLPKSLTQHMDFDTLTRVPDSFVDSSLKNSAADVLYEVQYKGTPAYIYLLFEHVSAGQARKQAPMPVRTAQYTCDIFSLHSKRYPKSKELPIVIPLVFYHGRRPYTGPTDIFELFGEHKALAKKVIFKPFHLVDLTQVEDRVLARQPLIGLMSFLMKHIYDKDLRLHMETIMALFREVAKRRIWGYIESAINYLFKAGEVGDAEEFATELAKNLDDDELRSQAMTIAEGLMAKGEARGKAMGVAEGKAMGVAEGKAMGVAEGKALGKAESKQQIARNALARGLNTSLIAEITSLDIAEIEALKLESVH